MVFNQTDCYYQLSTDAINYETMPSMPEKTKIALLKNGHPLYTNYLQALNRYFTDIQTAEVPFRFSDEQKALIINVFSKLNRLEPLIYESNELIQRIESLEYIIENKKEVLSFILNHLELLPIILESYPIIGFYFPNHSLALDVINDPDEKDSNMLALIIQTKLSVNEAYNKLDQLDDQWWLEVSMEIGDLACLHVEFQ